MISMKMLYTNLVIFLRKKLFDINNAKYRRDADEED